MEGFLQEAYTVMCVNTRVVLELDVEFDLYELDENKPAKQSGC